jgi:hypothetical protein
LLVVLAEDPLWLDAFEVSPGVFAPSYSPREDRLLISSLLSEGVLDVAAGEMRVRQRAAGANMSVDIDPGRAAITGDDAADQGRYLMREPTVINRAVATAPLSDSRIDRVIARVYDKTVTGTVHGWDYEVLTGAVAVAPATPVAPAVPKGAIPLFRFTVTSSTVAITDEMLIDERPQAAVIGRIEASGEVGVTGPNGRGRLIATSEPGRNFITLAGPGGTSALVLYAPDDSTFPGRWALLNGLTQFCLSAMSASTRDIRAHGNLDVVGGLASSQMALQSGFVATTESTTADYSDLPTVGPDVVFVAPPSGAVVVNVSAEASNSAAGNWALMSFTITRVSDGVVAFGTANDRAAGHRAGQNVMSSRLSGRLPGLTPGVEYRARAKYRAIGGTATFTGRSLVVIPSA